MIWWWIGGALVVLLLVVVYLSSTAGRLDRLHHRVESGFEALEAQLDSRATVTLDLARSGLLDPASSLVLEDAAYACLEGSDALNSAQAESDLSAALAAVFGSDEEVEALVAEPRGAGIVDDLSGACHRVEMSRRFYNDSVRACRQVRRHRLVRLFRLAGSAPFPSTAEFDATVPAGFLGR